MFRQGDREDGVESLVRAVFQIEFRFLPGETMEQFPRRVAEKEERLSFSSDKMTTVFRNLDFRQADDGGHGHRKRDEDGFQG